MTSETEEGQRLAEGKLKRITQGMGKIKAARKYENPIEFEESHKLWIDANHLPAIRGIDNAIWNRLHSIPCDVTIPKSEQDRELSAKLASEAEGILAWTVSGTRKWFAGGLGKPPVVEQAGMKWRHHSDQIDRFISDICVTGERAEAKGGQLYAAYKIWAEQASEHVIPGQDFARRIEEKFKKQHTERGNVYLGIRLLVENDGSRKLKAEAC
jgi:putative DNA primase/helicase